MRPLMAYAGDDLLDMTFRLAFAEHPELFTGRGRTADYRYTFTLTEPPTVQLRVPTRARPENMTIAVPNVDVVITTGGTAVPLSCSATATGTLLVRAGVLVVDGLQVTMNAGILSALAQQAMDQGVLPGVRAALRSVPIPQLNDAFGDGLDARVREGEVVAGPVLRIGARMGTRGMPDADDLPMADRPALVDDGAPSARMAAMVCAAAVNALLDEHTPRLRHTERRILANAAGVRASFSATTPTLRIVNGAGTATTRISTTLSAGINIPFFGWRWGSVAVPDVVVAVAHTLVAAGSNADVRLGQVSAINVVLDLPGWLGPVAGAIRGAVNGIANAFRGVINTIINGRRITVYQLPDVLPGTHLPARLTFVAGGLRYVGGSLRTIIRVRA